MTGPEGPNPLVGPQGLGDVQPGGPTESRAADPTAFRRLLEQLETVAKTDGTSASPGDDPTDLNALQDALDAADREYEQVMDLRQRLEAAFRNVSERSNDDAT